MEFPREITKLYQRTRMLDFTTARVIVTHAREAGYDDDTVMAMVYCAGAVDSFERSKVTIRRLNAKIKGLEKQIEGKAKIDNGIIDQIIEAVKAVGNESEGKSEDE